MHKQGAIIWSTHAWANTARSKCPSWADIQSFRRRCHCHCAIADPVRLFSSFAHSRKVCISFRRCSQIKFYALCLRECFTCVTRVQSRFGDICFAAAGPQLIWQSARQGSQLHRFQATTENIHVSYGLQRFMTFFDYCALYFYLLTYSYSSQLGSGRVNLSATNQTG